MMTNYERRESLKKFVRNITIGLIGVIIGISGFLLFNIFIEIAGTIIVGTAAYLQLMLVLEFREANKR